MREVKPSAKAYCEPVPGDTVIWNSGRSWFIVAVRTKAQQRPHHDHWRECTVVAAETDDRARFRIIERAIIEWCDEFTAGGIPRCAHLVRAEGTKK